MEIEQIVADLKSQGLEEEQIIASLEQMVQEGKITAEDFEKAKAMLVGSANEEEQDEQKEKEYASKLFGMKLM